MTLLNERVAESPASASPSADAPARPSARWRQLASLLVQLLLLLALSAAIWFGDVRMFTLHNDFPTAYHPDEHSKVDQLVDDSRNFNHPQLMLEATRLLTPPPAHAPRNTEEVARQGRHVSAEFCAAAAVLMAWAGFAAAGLPGFCCVGVAIALCPAMVGPAHYFKEDASLLFGVAAVVCAAAWAIRVRRPGPQLWSILALGAACGLAASGKYCGVVLLGPAALLSIIAPAVRRNWGLALAGPAIVVVFATAVWATINYRAATDWDHFASSLTIEEEHSITDHRGVTMDRPNTFFVHATWTEAMWPVKLLSIAALPTLGWVTWRRVKRTKPADASTPIQRPGWSKWTRENPDQSTGLGDRVLAAQCRTSIAFGSWLVLCMIVYSIMLAYSVILFFRYTVPVSMMLYAFAGLSIVWIASVFPRRAWQWTVIAVGFVTIAATQGARCADYTRQFGNDSRDALRKWVWTQLPTATMVAADQYAAVKHNEPGGLGAINKHVRVVRSLAADPPYTGSVADLRSLGVHYVIVVGSASDRFLDPHARAMDPEMEKVFAFYREIRAYPIVWSCVATHPMWTFTNPDIWVYDIGKAEKEKG